MSRNADVAYGGTTLPAGVRSRFLDGVNGLAVHALEAGFEDGARPCVVLLHGFPELAYSWRKQLPPLAAAGFHVVAPDQRGYGRTTGWDGRYDGDIAPFRLYNLALDVVALVEALGRRSVAAVVGHDFGSPVAAYCALIRPDVFRSAVLMSAPFAGPPPVRDPSAGAAAARDIHRELAALPVPRKHYQRYYTTRAAAADMHGAPQGVRDFLRAYFHVKSADWTGNRPFPLKAWTAEELAKLPRYYVMDLDRTMPESVAPEMPSPAEIEACAWLTDEELGVYSAEYGRLGFQGGLQWYRCANDPLHTADLRMFAGRAIEVPTVFIAGAADWGVYQRPGALEAMCDTACARMRGIHLVEGAGHWVQQERPEAVNRRLLEFLGATAPAAG